MFEAGIIAPIRFSEWVSNLVPTRKKSREIRLCVDLRNLNQVSLKDHYPLPKMDHILQRVVCSSRISLLDGFSGFNQILVHPDDQDKTTFTTSRGTFKYVKMPFGLKNVGATFQRAMDIAFAKEIHDFLAVYLDDLTPFSKSDQEHLKHLRQIFMTCRKYGISLNPKKSLFSHEEGKLLGHIISKDGIRIDPERIQAILQIPYPRNIKELQAFLGKINFLRRFIPNLAELIRLLRNMLKKDAKVKWSLETKQAFENIKTALTQTPVLTIPQFDKDFIIFSFASEHTIVVVLLQKDDQDVKKFVVSCHKCQIFEGKRKLLPLPLKPISTEKPFQQWGLDFIGEIHPSYSGQHKWILTTIDYFTKWIEAIPCRQANDSTIIQFLESNILSRYGCPKKIITDNTAAFKSKKIINFCHKFHITLGHSTAYYPQGNGLAESSNKSLINIIKKLLEENKKNWHRKLTNALWADRISTKKSIGMSPYELVYGMEARFPSSLGIPSIKLLQEIQAEPNDMQRRVNQTIHLQQTREQVYERAQMLQEKLKKMFDKKAKVEDFRVGRKVLRWDS
eukprot:PITA_15826